MDEVLKNKWMVRLFFAGTALFFTGFVLYIVRNPRTPGYRWARPMPAAVSKSQVSFEPGDKISMTLMQEYTIGTNRFLYRGLDAGNLRFEVVIPDLDPDYAYSHRIPIQAAKRGFQLAGREFRLVKASRAKVRLLFVH